jgi:hypothetical protein
MQLSLFRQPLCNPYDKDFLPVTGRLFCSETPLFIEYCYGENIHVHVIQCFHRWFILCIKWFLIICLFRLKIGFKPPFYVVIIKQAGTGFRKPVIELAE